jgi:hypothetical protein
MTIHELRDSDEARQFLLQGLCLQRTVRPHEETVSRILEWCAELASEGTPVLPLCLIADVGHLAFGATDEEDSQERGQNKGTSHGGFEAGLIRGYEDYVLGKLFSDSSFERGADALVQYSGERDRARGLAFLLTQITERSGCGGVILSPGVIRELQRQPPEEVLHEAWQSLAGEPSPLLVETLKELVEAIRNCGNVLGPEDVFELEHGTALAGFGQRVALRQLLRTSAQFAEAFPQQPTRNPSRLMEVATHIEDEDTYPVGGFTSISNRGSIESLLHSQLSYMETDPDLRPDLFDVFFLRGELLYYSRDENQFFRRRRTLLISLFPDLAKTRVKDAGLPCQRIILTLALLHATVSQLIQWLSEESLVFEFVFVDDAGKQLANERELIATVFRDQILNGTVVISTSAESELSSRAEDRARTSLCHLMTVSQHDATFDLDNAFQTRLIVDSPQPRLGIDDRPAESIEADSAEADSLIDTWSELASVLSQQLA